MKKIALLILTSILIITGCQDGSSILEPTSNNTVDDLSKGRPIFYYDMKKADATPELYRAVPLDIKTKVSKTLTINGEKGGKVYLLHEYADPLPGQDKKAKLYAELDIPKGAFVGELTFDIIFDVDNLAVELYPSPFTFDKPVLLDLKFENVDLSGFDPNLFVFDYLDGEEPENLIVKSVKMDINDNKLTIEGAELHHFSRYGWTRTRSSY